MQEAGADVVKQWSAANDSRTRHDHSKLDNQLRELDDEFDVSGHTALYPGGFGIAKLDIHCRCTVLQRARWALSEAELAELAQPLDTDTFEEFLRGYGKKVDVEIDELTPCLRRMSDGKIVGTYTKELSREKLKKLPKKEWMFQWDKTPLNYQVYGLYANDDDRIQGLISLKLEENYVRVCNVESAYFNQTNNPLFSQKRLQAKEYNGVGGHLFAEAVRHGYEESGDGTTAVVFEAKTELQEHYSATLGAKPISGREMVLDEISSLKLYNRYYEKNK